MTHHNEQEAIGGYEADTIMGDASDTKMNEILRCSSSQGEPCSIRNADNQVQPSPTPLNEAVKRIADLDAKRTLRPPRVDSLSKCEADLYVGGYLIAALRDWSGQENSLNDARYYEAAPLMAATVAQQAAIIDGLMGTIESQKQTFDALMGKVEQQRAEIERLSMEANAGRQAEAEANAECEQQRAVMEMAREAIDNSIAFIGYASHVPEKVEACEAALTALDAALGRV